MEGGGRKRREHNYGVCFVITCFVTDKEWIGEDEGDCRSEELDGVGVGLRFGMEQGEGWGCWDSCLVGT